MQGSPRWRVSAVLAVIATLLIGCSGASRSTEADHASQPDAGPPQSGGAFVWNVTTEAPTLDPHKSASALTQQSVSGLVYSKLLEFKTGPGLPYGSMETQADLAETWEHSDDATVWTFNLRHGVKFHNKAPVNGRELTSADVVCTMDRIKALPGVQLSLIEGVAQVATPDPYTVVFTLREPYAAFDETVANYYLSILPCEAARGEFDLATNAIGTGPFVLDSWTRNVSKTYSRNPSYFIPGKPYLDALTMVTIADPTASIAAYRAGELDSTRVTAQLLPSVLNSVPDSRRIQTHPVYMGHIVMNQSVKPFDNLKVRRAVQMAFDRGGLARSTGVESFELSGPVPPMLFGGLTSEEAGTLAPYDPGAAKKLLAEAGYPNGFSVELTTTDGYGPTVVNSAQWVQEDLRKIGITASLRILDYATWFTTWAAEDYAIGYSLSSAFLSADEWLSSYYLSTGARNWFAIDDPKLDDMINEQRGMLDRDRREKLLLDISRYIEKNVANPVMSYAAADTTVQRPWVHDWWPHPEYGPSWVKNMWIGPDSPRR